MAYDKQIHMAFRSMRKDGLLARMNYMSSIDVAEEMMAKDTKKYLEKGKIKREDTKGCVYFTSQDNDKRVKNNKFSLSFGNIIMDDGEEIGIGDKEVGELVVKCLTDAGFKTNWDGNPENRIEVDLTEVKS